jgi:hypothetical protein
MLFLAAFVIWVTALVCYCEPIIELSLRRKAALKENASRPDPTTRASFCKEVEALAEKLESFGERNGDTDVRLLALIIRHSGFAFSTRYWEPEDKAKRLRQIVEVAAPWIVDRWWRTKDEQAAARAATFREGGRDAKFLSRAN